MVLDATTLYYGQAASSTKSRDRWSFRASNSPCWLSAMLPVMALVLVQTLPVRAEQDQPVGTLSCLDPGLPLVKIPELVSTNGILRGTILLTDQERRLAFRWPPGRNNVPGKPGLTYRCEPQFVRVYHGGPALPKGGTEYPDPIPAPTLRARVGDIIQLTFLNQIDPGNFGQNIDRAERGSGTGCDEVPGIYPISGDTFPNCFHGSSTGNIHFHGTHTNPNSTGDNVFIQVRPSPREGDRPVVTAESVKYAFDKFFADCESHLKIDALAQWPRKWSDFPEAWTDDQQKLLEAYDQDKPRPQKLWQADKQQIDAGLWPQYYIGAYPYCFRLPEYTPDAVLPSQAAHAGMGLPVQAPASVKMGQAPGTHWYHAHKHGSTAINVSNGLTGAFIIEGKYDDELDAAYGEKGWTRRQPALVINQLGVRPNLERGSKGRADKGEDFSVNGRLKPVLRMKPGEVQLWRIINTSSRSGAFFVGPPDGFEWRQLAQDGVQFSDENYQSDQNRNAPFLMTSGNRVDLLVKAPVNSRAEPYPVIVLPAVARADLRTNPAPPNVTLLSVEVSGAKEEMDFVKRAPMFPPFLADITDDEVRSTKTITFETKDGNNHTIDGKRFDDTVGQLVRLNAAEEWKVENRTVRPPIDHPFHIHVNPFQVVEVFDPNEPLVDASTGKPMLDAKKQPILKYVFDKAAITDQARQCYLDPNDPETWKPCHKVKQSNLVWWDVFPIPSGRSVPGKSVVVPGYFKMRSRFVDYPGWFVIHCHILAHEDRGMMMVVEVAPFLPPVSHH
jgi:FtsP/CotA-like multicopper oxidase with cupredoxin domain